MYFCELFDNPASTTLATMNLDFGKAFDKVSHGKLLEQLSKAGMRGGVLDLIENSPKGR